MHRAFSNFLAIALGLALASTARAQVDASEARIGEVEKGSRATVRGIADIRAQVLRTMAAYNAIFVDGAKDRERMHANVRKEAQRLELLKGRMSTRAVLMSAEADTRFRLLEDAATDIGDPEGRSERQRRLAVIQAEEGAIRSVRQTMDRLCTPLLEALRGQVSGVDTALDGGAGSSIEPAATDLNELAQSLVQRLDESAAALEEALETLNVAPSR